LTFTASSGGCWNAGVYRPLCRISAGDSKPEKRNPRWVERSAYVRVPPILVQGCGEFFGLLNPLLVVPLPQRRRALLFFDGFLDESDDLPLFGYVIELCNGEREG